MDIEKWNVTQDQMVSESGTNFLIEFLKEILSC